MWRRGKSRPVSDMLEIPLIPGQRTPPSERPQCFPSSPGWLRTPNGGDYSNGRTNGNHMNLTPALPFAERWSIGRPNLATDAFLEIARCSLDVAGDIKGASAKVNAMKRCSSRVTRNAPFDRLHTKSW